MQILAAANWGLSIGQASYYGWRWLIHVGPFCVFVWRVTP